MLVENNKKNGGLPSRIGIRFHKEVNKIMDQRLRNGNSKNRVSIEKITNLIVRNKLWKEIYLDIVAASEEEVNQYGL